MSEPIVWMLESKQAVWFEREEPFDMPDDVEVTPLVVQPGHRKFAHASHVQLEKGTNNMICTHCGQHYPIHMQVPMSMMTAIIDAFLEIHHDCEEVNV